jgi:diguanylate cyclase (GGDEF)-like protein
MLLKLSIVDPLTELYNRRFATEHLPLELARADRFGYPITALLLDLNGFKAINDEHGHAAGDLALSEFARNLRRCFRSSDLPVRMGGDEFLVLLPECPAENVPLALTHLRNVEIEFEGARIPITFSAGWSQHECGESADALLARADEALYVDKRTASAERQRRQAEMMLFQAQKLQTMGELAGGVTHDFNNMVTIIRGYSSLLLEQMTADDPLRHKIEQMDRAAQHAAQLTRQLMDFARGKTLNPDQTVDLNRTVQELEPIIKAVLGRRIILHIQADPATVVARADPSQLQQIILNIVVNARDAMPAGGRLIITTANRELDEAFAAAHSGARPGAYSVLEFLDTGHGIPEDVKQHIFDPFFTTKEHRGTGLGLSIVYGTVKQLGGYLWLDSEVGVGSTFTAYFPRQSTHAKAERELVKAAVA